MFNGVPQKLQSITGYESATGVKPLPRRPESDESPEGQRHPDQVQQLIQPVLMSEQVIMKKTLDHGAAPNGLKTACRLSRIVENQYLF